MATLPQALGSYPLPGVKVIADAVGHLLSIEDCRQHCEIVAIDGTSDSETHPDDALLLSKLDAAVEWAEEFTGRSIAIRTYEMALDEFPCGAIEILRPPLIELVSFTCADDSDGAIDPAAYVVDDYHEPARLRAVSSWPAMTAAPNAVKIRFRAGYSTAEQADSDARALPSDVRAAVLLVMGHLYENREESVEKALSTIPMGAADLLRHKRVRLGMS